MIRGILKSISQRLVAMVKWVFYRPIVMINLAFILAIFGTFYYLLSKPIDVLQDWSVTITDVRTYHDGVPVFNPGDSLVFSSKSTKLFDAAGVTTRMLVCEAIGNKKAREIQLDTLPAVRPAGQNPPRDNAITIPDVTQFDGLPRYCVLHIDVCYDNVILWRDHCESNDTVKFIVEEISANPEDLKRQLEDLKRRQNELEARIAAYGVTSTPTSTERVEVMTQETKPTQTTNNIANNSTTNNMTNNQKAEDPGLLDSLLNWLF